MSEIKDGVTCLECQSVFFSIKRLIEHVRDEHDEWFKSGDGAVIRITLYTLHKETEAKGYGDGYSDCLKNKEQVSKDEEKSTG